MREAARRAQRILPQTTVLLFGLLSIWPLLQTRSTCSDDGIFHIHKALGLEAAIQLGHWFPRWSPHMAHGFGYPLYNFYAPLGSYVLAGLHALGFIYPLALHIALALCILLAGLAVFALVRDWWGPWAGMAAAVVYQTSPYLAFNVLFRGALAETLALVWLPLVLWTIDRAMQRDSLRWGALAALCFAGLIYTHNASALLATPFIAGYAAFVVPHENRPRLLGRAAIIMLAGFAISAHFWLPALAERDLVQTEQLLVPPVFTYNTNFLTSSELLAPPVATQQGLLNPSPPKALGAIATGLALLGAGTMTLRRPRTYMSQPKGGVRLLFFFAALLVYGALTLPLTLPLWDALPLLPFVQFPWRMLGVATLCAAALSGKAVFWFNRSNRAWVGATIIAFVATLSHLSWWYPRYCAEFAEATIGTMLEYEYNTFTVGTSAKGEFLPKTVRYLPKDKSVAQALQAGETPARLRGLPADAILNILDSNPLDFRATLSTPEAFKAVYQMFYYLGWRVSIDGQPHPLEVAAGSGLMHFYIPAGEHELRVYFGTTALRALASSVALAALLATIAVLLSAPPRPTARTWRHTRAPTLLLALPLGLLAAKLLLIERSNNVFHRTSIEATSLGIPLTVSLDNGLDTIAYTVRPNPVPSGGSFEIILYLTPRNNTPQRDYRPLFRLKSADNLIWNLNPNETVPPRWHREPPPTQYWPVGKYGEFARQYQVLPGTPPGEYRLDVTFFDHASLETSKTITPEGVPPTDRIDLGTVTVARPSTPALPAALGMKTETETSLIPAVTLLGGSADRRQAMPGDLMTVTLFFHADSTPNADEDIILALKGTDFARRLEPTPGYPTGQWQRGDIWRGQHLLRLPANLPDGEHIWTVRGSSDVSEVTYLEKLRVTAPERIFAQPSVTNTARLTFGNNILLSGYDWSPPQALTTAMLEVRLIWRALDTPDEDVTVFVHLESLGGELIAQHDGVPVGWSRPTPGWLPGEYLVDLHYLAIPGDTQPGAYRLYAGLADRTNGRRLQVTTGHAIDDRVFLGQFDVAP